MYKKGDKVRVYFDAIVEEGDEASNYVVLVPGGHFGLYGKAIVHFTHLIKDDDDGSDTGETQAWGDGTDMLGGQTSQSGEYRQPQRRT